MEAVQEKLTNEIEVKDEIIELPLDRLDLVGGGALSLDSGGW